MRTLLLALSLTLPAPSLARAETVRLPPGAEVTLRHGDGRVGAYISEPRGFETASYWIEGPTGLIFIDTQFLLSAGAEALDWAEKTTGKKVLLAVVLHPNPDKFNGVETFKKRGISVVTSAQVRALIPAVHEDRHHWFYERYKPDYPDVATLPESFGSATRELSAGGVTVTAHVLGAGASGAHVVVEWNKHLFPGDLVTNTNHSWLELGQTVAWLERLSELRALAPEFIHPGRGPAGGPELLDREAAYLRKVIELVAAEHPRGAPPPAALERVQAKMEALFPAYGYTHFLEIGLPAEWARQADRAKGRK